LSVQHNTMNKMSLETLGYLGLDPEQSKVYAACLKLGKGKAQEIAKTANIHRTVVYQHLEKLAERGLVHVSVVKGTREYAVANPNVILSIFKQREKEIEAVLPLLLSLYAAGHPSKPQFRFYTDIAGVRTVLEEVLESSSKFYRHIGAFYDREFLLLLGLDFLKDWSERRIARGVDHRSLRPEGRKQLDREMDDIFIGRGKKFLRDYRYLSIPADLPILIYLFDEKVAFVGARVGHVYAAVLESKDVYDVLGHIFDRLWETAEVPEKEMER